jgi:hypothetical protein
MASAKLTAVIAALALSGALATAAHADPVTVTTTTTDPTKALAGTQWSPMTQHKSFEWDAAKSRFGLKFDIEQQPGANGDWKNVQAGAFFKVTPSLHVGAGVSLTDQPNTTANPLAQQPVPPRVHLETTWKF